MASETREAAGVQSCSDLMRYPQVEGIYPEAYLMIPNMGDYIVLVWVLWNPASQLYVSCFVMILQSPFRPSWEQLASPLFKHHGDVLGRFIMLKLLLSLKVHCASILLKPCDEPTDRTPLRPGPRS